MTVIASIVEGDGEVVALPILLRRIGEWQSPGKAFTVLPPIRVRRDRFINREDEFCRVLQLAASKCGMSGWILVLLDADDDCPAELGPHILARAQAIIPHRPVSVVFANREYEAWFLASAASLNGFRGFVFEYPENFDPEHPRNAKGWLGRRMLSGTYREITDQPAFSAKLDLEQAIENSRSFRKLCSEWLKQMQ
jgi:hypothetical protein